MRLDIKEAALAAGMKNYDAGLYWFATAANLEAFHAAASARNADTVAFDALIELVELLFHRLVIRGEWPAMAADEIEARIADLRAMMTEL